MARAKKKAAKKKAVRKGQPGRPSSFTQETADLICLGLSEGMSLRKILRENPELPDMTTIFRWLSQNETFRQQYARAKHDGSEVWAEEILEIADTPPEMTAEGKLDSASVQDKRVRIDTRKWLLSKLQPKKYGEKLDIDGKLETTVVRRNLTGAGGED